MNRQDITRRKAIERRIAAAQTKEVLGRGVHPITGQPIKFRKLSEFKSQTRDEDIPF